MENPIKILRTNLPKVLRGTHSLIVSVIVTPNTKANPFRRCFYISLNKIYSTIQITIKEEDFKIPKLTDKNKIKLENQKYEIIGDFIEDLYLKQQHISTIDYIPRTINYIHRYGIIDTIVIVNNPTHTNAKLLYDRIGHFNVGYQWLANTQHWKRKRQAAEYTGHPKLYQERAGKIQSNEDLENQIRQMESEFKRKSRLEPLPPTGGPFSFGKKLRSIKTINKYLKSI